MYKHLTQYERYYIWQRNATFENPNKIAKALKVHRSTVYRELSRNKNEYGQYITGSAELKSSARRSMASSTRKNKFTAVAIEYITTKLKATWSPEQISGRMKSDLDISISHVSIYAYIWKDKANGGKLYKLLPHQGKAYKYGNPNKVKIPNRTDISKRPKVVESKSRIGDMEGDTIVGARGGSKDCLLTLVDRKSKFCFIKRTLDKSAASIQIAMESVYAGTTVPFKTITLDNGTEFCRHQEIAGNLGCSIYFARPYKSCDRGLNEHTNGLIRRFFPKKTDFATITDQEIQHVQNLLNERPRKSLGYLTPNEVMNKHLNRIYRRRSKTVALQT